MTNAPLLGPFIQSFFTQHLLQHKKVSSQTIASYRDTFRLLLQFFQAQRQREPAALLLPELNAETILAFLDHLEQQRHNCVRSRNVRLAAIRTFFRWVALRDPASLEQATRILAIPQKRTEKKLVQALTRTEIEAILATPDLTTWSGRRDHVLLLTLYNSGARVSELINLHRQHVTFGSSTVLQLHGKGRKEKRLPLWKKTAQTLQAWFRELEQAEHPFAFPNARGQALSRDGVNYLLQQAVQQAACQCPTLTQKKISPHTLRHTTALHLLQSGVDITLIALWLGHESTETTHIYLEADLQTKEQALEKLTPAGQEFKRYRAEDKVLAFDWRSFFLKEGDTFGRHCKN
ncbi:MAG TPA: tyrosine-type recombinase/integrase [Blastocatellia bacterium]|nr:tyrosine-type recombinase/integrase [Blastocatellia bacterium]